MKFLHTSDWQLGRPFSRVDDTDKRHALRQVRLDAVDRIAAAARDNGCSFVVVAGDLFDSTTPDDTTVRDACVRIGRAGLDVYAIPGNHDHAGPDGVWERDFLRNAVRLNAPNFHVLTAREPVVRDDAVILPFPLFRRQDAGDVLGWVRAPGALDGLPQDRPWIVLAHGSVQDFGEGAALDEDDDSSQPNLLDLDALRAAVRPDYIALGDWHGCKRVAADAWYSGTPEPDRFPKGGDYRAGVALVVDVPARGAPPSVAPVETGAVRWIEPAPVAFAGEESLAAFETLLDGLLRGRTGQDSLKLSLSGFLGFEERRRLDELLRAAKAATLRFKAEDRVVPKPSDAELAALRDRAADPLIARVAARLDERSRDPALAEADRRVALDALRELYLTANADD